MAFPGGSAYTMSHQISEGYILVTDRTWSRMNKQELDKLTFEFQKLLRELRANQPDGDDTMAIQKRNRKISRVNTSMSMLKSYRLRRKV